MPTFIDESGDTGPLARGGKPYFRLAAVWVPTHKEIEVFQGKLEGLRRELGQHEHYEFRFSITHDQHWRRRFYECALATDFQFAVSVIDKTNQYWATASSIEQQWACVTELAALLRPTYLWAESIRPGFRESVTVDDNRDFRFLDLVKRQFRALKGDRQFVKKVAFKNSKSECMLQLADMVCGARGVAIDGRDGTFYDLISDRDVENRPPT